MSVFGGTSEFGSAVFGGDPSAFLYLDIDAEITTEARRIMANGLCNGTTLMGYYFTVGDSGHEPLNYLSAIPVNPDSSYSGITSPTEIAYIEHPNLSSVCFYCVLDNTVSLAISSVYIWSKVINSPGNPSNGTDVIFAIGHFPLLCKNDRMTTVLRVTVQA